MTSMRAYNDLLRARVEMDRAAELLRTPAFDRPGPIIESADALLDDANRAFQRFLEAFLPSSRRWSRRWKSASARCMTTICACSWVCCRMLTSPAIFPTVRVTQSSERFIETIDAFFARNQQLGQHLAERFDGPRAG
ncbi:hypothetical protein DSL92_04715 [Billgrantia gudaonensis]|uniref:Uncharacterized protein n=1 Tax=Billgrantia gudaonensis TaxID=376427 RepID=A0A432JJC2_9GAMM|nr:hypothetical protein DSL92_04715 [Halomonas gudaonensis]